MDPPKFSIPTAELLEDAGISSDQIREKVLTKSSSILRQSTTTKGETIPHDVLVSHLQVLTHSVMQSSNNPEELEGKYQRIIEDVVKPYIQVLATEIHQGQAHAQCKAVIQDLLLSLMTCTRSSRGYTIEYISSLLDCIRDNMLAPNESAQCNTFFIFNFYSELLQKISIESIEEDIDLSSMFQKVLDLLKLGDSKICFVVASSIIPRFITPQHQERAERVWSMIEMVYLGKANIEHDRMEFVLTFLCCSRDIFVHHDKSSPFSSPFIDSVIGLAPIVDLRNRSSFWSIIQEGLVSLDPFSRKRCMYLLHCVLLSAHSLKEAEIVCSQGSIFWWGKEYSSRLRNVWDDLILILETMEEKQIHIIKPVKKHLSNVLDAARQQINGHYVLHISWVRVALSRVFDHHEAKSIIQWGVVECLGMELADSPLLCAGNWDFICGKLLQVLGLSFLYNRAQGLCEDCCPPLTKKLVVFLQSFVSELPKEDKAVFLAKFLSSCAELKPAEVPLVYISYAVSKLPLGPLIEKDGLAAIRSIVLSSILTHKPSLRAASQMFLLKAVCSFTNNEEVDYLEVLQTLGSFREAECLTYGSQFWKEASRFLVNFSQAKSGSEKEGELGLFSYVFSCMEAYLNMKSGCGDHLPSIPTLARAVLLAVDGECTTSGTRVISTENRSLEESLTLLLAQVMDIIATATNRAYLAADAVNNALEFLFSLLHLLPAAPGLTECHTAQALYSCLSPWFPDTMRYLHSRLLIEESKMGEALNLTDNLFLLNTLSVVYNFMMAFGFSFSKFPDIGLARLSQKAANVLTSLSPNQSSVTLSPSFLGSISTLGWLSTCSLHPSQPPHPHTITAPPTLPLHLLAVIAALPMPLSLSRASTSVCDASKSDQVVGVASWRGDGVSHVRVEWGPLVCHCLSAYWNCLLCLMKHDSDWIMKRGADSLIQMCLDGLDSASESLPIIIQCLALLVNESPAGPSLLCSFCERLWSLIMELKDQPKIFYEVMESFVQLVFHPSLLLLPTCDLNELQEEYVKELFLLGEFKPAVCNLLVNHVCSIWRESLYSAEGSAARRSELLVSLSAHKQLLLQGCTFGTVHRKNLRIVADTEDFLESVGISSSQDQYSRSDCSVRVKLLMFLLELFSTFSKDDCDSLSNGFLQDLVSTITAEILKMSGNTPKYYINSHTHRVKLRLLQLLILSLRYTNKTTCQLVGERLMSALQYDNQRSVRYLMEWIAALVFTRFPDLAKSILYPCLDVGSEGRLSRMCSFFTIALHLGLNIKSTPDKAQYYREMVPAISKWTSSHHFTTRLYAQGALYRVWQDCRTSEVGEILKEFQVLNENIKFMQVYGDYGKFAHKLQENVFFSLIDSVKDVSIQNPRFPSIANIGSVVRDVTSFTQWTCIAAVRKVIFHTLPLLCDAPREDLIPAQSFVGEAKELTNILYELSCQNENLLQAAHDVMTSTTVMECGSDTKSIAYQLKSKTNGASETLTLAPSTSSQSSDVQKKITPWSNPKTVVNELFPESLSTLSGMQEKDINSEMILVTTLLSKLPNIGGLCRTSEIFGVSEVVVGNINILKDVQFQSLSVTAEKWVTVSEVKLNALKDYLLTMQAKGYRLVGAEQTAQSKCLTDYSFKNKTVLLLGNEREGIPVDLIHLLDDCVEIPQLGVVRSLNVHVSGALLVWEYAKQHSLHHVQ